MYFIAPPFQVRVMGCIFMMRYINKVSYKQEAQILSILLLPYKVCMQKAMYMHKYWHLHTVLASQPQSLLIHFAAQMSVSSY